MNQRTHPIVDPVLAVLACIMALALCLAGGRASPRTGERLAGIEQTMKLMERDMESISRALWRAGIKVSTNGVQP